MMLGRRGAGGGPAGPEVICANAEASVAMAVRQKTMNRPGWRQVWRCEILLMLDILEKLPRHVQLKFKMQSLQ